MKAAVYERYGAPSVVQITEVPKPTPRPGEVLVRVRSVAVTSADSRIRSANFPRGFAPFARLVFGVRRPRRPILGNGFSGVIEAIGAKADGLSVGDHVTGMTGARMGAHAEYVCVAAKRVVLKPTAVSHDQAAGVLFGGVTALHLLREKGSLREGCTVLVNGASGAIGTSAIQLAAQMGGIVTGVTSGRNADLVRDLGAKEVIDYTAVDLDSITERYDIVLDTVGNISIGSGRRLLTESGVLLLAVGTLSETLRARGNVKAGPAPERPEDIRHLLHLIEVGDLTVVLEQVSRLDQIGAAYERVDAGRKVGNIVLNP